MSACYCGKSLSPEQAAAGQGLTIATCPHSIGELKVFSFGAPGQPPLTREDVAAGHGPDRDHPFTDHVPAGAIQPIIDRVLAKHESTLRNLAIARFMPDTRRAWRWSYAAESWVPAGYRGARYGKAR